MSTKHQIITKQDTGTPWYPVSVGGEAEISDPGMLGGKGAGLNEMIKLGLPVPDVFTIYTEACEAYQLAKVNAGRIRAVAKKAYKELKTRNGGVAPIVSVRSGARHSMPGMLSTVLNVGLTSKTFPKLAKRVGDKVAFDCKRRLIQSYATVVFGLPSQPFEDQLQSARDYERVGTDGELSSKTLEQLVARFELILSMKNLSVPDSIEAQLAGAIVAVFASWNNPEAITWRKIHGIPEDGGTAVNVQTMVFGNAEGQSGTGVLFTRDPATGQDCILGEWLPNAQGEDLVSGVRTPQPIATMMDEFKPQFSELLAHADKLEKHYHDMRDIEFTVMDGKLWLLQDRAGKRSDEAAVQIAVDLAKEEQITQADALARIPYSLYAKLRGSGKQIVSPEFDVAPVATGLAASPGIVSGTLALTSVDAIALAAKGPVILVREQTETKDIAGIDAAAGVITQSGGVTCHAAVCARAVNTPCVVGCEGILVSIAMDNPTTVTIDGSTGKIWFDTDVPIHKTGANDAVETLIGWAFDASDAVRQTNVLTGPGQHVMCGSWKDTPDAQLESLKVLANTEIPMCDVVFDLSDYGRFNHEEDEGLTTMFGVAVEKSNDASMLNEIEALLSVDGRGALAYLPGGLQTRAPEFKQAGYAVAMEVATIADVFAADGMMTMDEDAMLKIFGTQSAFLRFMEMLKGDGIPMEMLESPITEDELAQKVFGGGESWA